MARVQAAGTSPSRRQTSEAIATSHPAPVEVEHIIATVTSTTSPASKPSIKSVKRYPSPVVEDVELGVLVRHIVVIARPLPSGPRLPSWAAGATEAGLAASTPLPS
eukprot:13193143-Heterocapsa_arctica.AAC.1